ncbi:hypothetical protein [Chlamydia sp.]|uniref:hypothetical protein n=1 Tax=Chlamydia sp. TaxID=35827 RepID=UPI0025B7F17C|nr:hypothetical protein [Chlamydia sp.]
MTVVLTAANEKKERTTRFKRRGAGITRKRKKRILLVKVCLMLRTALSFSKRIPIGTIKKNRRKYL